MKEEKDKTERKILLKPETEDVEETVWKRDERGRALTKKGYWHIL